MYQTETEKWELEWEESEQIAGGSWPHPEQDIREAGIGFLKEDGTPGEFGYLRNTGEHYFHGKLPDIDEMTVLCSFSHNVGRPAALLDEANFWFDNVRRCPGCGKISKGC